MKNKKNEYEIILKEQEGRFFLFMPELCIYTEGDDLYTTYQDMVERKKELLESLEYGGYGDYIPSNTNNKTSLGIFKDILPLLTKYTLVSLILLMFVFVSTSFIANKISQLSLVEFLKNQTHQVISIVDRQLLEISDDEKKRRIEKFSKYAQELKPYIDTLDVNKVKD